MNATDKRLQVNAQVYIAGADTESSFVSLRLDQSFGEHHRFWVQLDYDTLSKSFMDSPISQVKLIGEKINIKLIQGSKESDNHLFVGVISDVSMTGNNGKHGYIELSGYSSTIILDRGKHMEVYSEMSLDRLFELMTYNLPQEHVKVKNNPRLKTRFDHLMQYDESDWEFLQRVAAIYGECLYWDGRYLCFGEVSDQKGIVLTYDKEITSFKLCSRLVPNQFQNFHYLPEQHTTIKRTAPVEIPGANNLVRMAAVKSEIFDVKTPYKLHSDVPAGDYGELQEMVARRKTRNAAQMVYLVGEAKTCDPRIGRLLEINMPDGMSKNELVGTFMVTKITHIVDQNHRYRCQFEGASASLQYMPIPELKMPHAHPLVATVKSNADPLGQGRVQIDFDFTNNYTQGWFRVMTPDAGQSKVVDKNRGFVHVPEVGDQVMVDFEMGDPNRPFILGSFYHQGNGQGGGANNAIKSHIYRSGVKVIVNEDEGSYHVEDPAGSIYHSDGKGNIAVTAPKNMTFTAGENITMSAGKSILQSANENVSVDAGKNISQYAGADLTQSATGNITESSDNRTEMVEKDFNRQSETANEVGGQVSIFSQKENMSLQSKKTVQIKSAEKSKLF